MTNRYIITFDNSLSRTSVLNVIHSYDAKIRHLFELIPAVAIEVDHEKVEALKKEQVVNNIISDIRSEENKPFPFKFSDSDGKIRYRVPEDYNFNTDKLQREQRNDINANPGIAIIDTGVDKQYPVLRGRVKKEYDLTGEGVTDFNGHGTIVASIAVKGTNLSIISVKVGNKKGIFWESDVMAGIEIARKEAVKIGKPIVVNLSLGVYNKNCIGNCPLCSIASAATGMLSIVAAAGNIPGLTSCPAKAKGVLAVGALSSLGKIADYSGTGEIYAPGNIKFKVVDSSL